MNDSRLSKLKLAELALPLELVRSRLHYEPGTGYFTRAKCRKSTMVGQRAGNKKANGYRAVWVNGAQFLEHRLAVFYVTGAWPAAEVDHRNGVRDDNRWDNLRCVDSRANKENQRRPRSDNSTGFLGVFPACDADKFVAQIQVAGKRRHLGRFDTPQAAHKAYIAAKRELHQGGTL